MILNDQRWFGSFKERTAGVGTALERASKIRGILHHESLASYSPLNLLSPTANCQPNDHPASSLVPVALATPEYYHAPFANSLTALG